MVKERPPRRGSKGQLATSSEQSTAPSIAEEEHDATTEEEESDVEDSGTEDSSEVAQLSGLSDLSSGESKSDIDELDQAIIDVAASKSAEHPAEQAQKSER